MTTDPVLKASVKERLPIKKQEKKDQPRKLTFKEAKELEALPGRIEILEQEQKELYDRMATPEFYKNPGDIISREGTRVEELKHELETAYERWEVLESIREEIS